MFLLQSARAFEIGLHSVLGGVADAKHPRHKKEAQNVPKFKIFKISI